MIVRTCIISGWVFLMFVNSCSKKSQTSSSTSYQDLANERFGKDNFDCVENENMTFVLCKHQIGEKDLPVHSWEYFVYDKNTGKVSMNDTVNNGNVKWFSANEIEVSKIPGTMAQGQTMDDYAWIIDVIKGTRVKKSDYQKR